MPSTRTYSPLGSRPGSPRSAAMTPRTMQAKTAWWLAVASIALSIFSLINSSMPNVSWSNGFQLQGKRALLKSFLSPEDSKLLYQNKPLLLAEEDLSEAEIKFLHNDQRLMEDLALQGGQNAVKARANVVHQLIAEFKGEPISEEAVKKLHRRWSQFTVSQQDLHSLMYTDDYDDTNSHGDVAGGRLEFWDDEEGGQAFLQAEPEPLDSEDVAMSYPIITESDQNKAETNVAPTEDHASANELPPASETTFLEVLANCRTLACLKDAHTRPLEQRKFNFPHALLIGWQKSATTSIYVHLDRHPEVLASDAKEPEFFTRDCKDNPVSGCPLDKQAAYIERTLQRDDFIASSGNKMVFEASTHYAMNGDLLAQRAAQTMPWVKIVASLREPISRAASMMIHMADHNNVGCMLPTDADLYTCLTTASQLTGHPGPFNYVDSPHGNYSFALRAWMEAFPRDQVHILQYEALMVSADAATRKLAELKTFLDLDASKPKRGPEGLDKSNVRKNKIHPEGWPMRKDQYKRLIDMVRPDAQGVAALIEEFGQGSAQEWLSLWEAVWMDNLDNHCNADGDCLIQLS